MLERPMYRRSLLSGGVAAVASLAAPRLMAATGFPGRMIRMVVTTPAGAGPDAYARMFAESLSQKLGVQVLIENRPSGNGFLAMSATKSYPADGYTILMGVAAAVHHQPGRL